MERDRADIHTSGIPVLCRSCEARHRGLCGVLNETELKDFARHTRKVVHEPGRELSGETLPVTSYANVMHGVVKLTKTMEDGRQQIVGLQFAPDFLGRIFGRTHEVRAEAASEVELCVVPAGALEAMVEKTPALEHRLMQQTLRELDEARDWMLTLGRKSAEEKIASFLVLIATHAVPGEETVRFALPLSRSDIADFLGLTIETVSRQLTRLKTRGIIALEGRRGVVIEDMDALRVAAAT
jgi:CRP/FNR family transcriptional regulator, anaerobic regulatory protein